jgi:peptide/nickel transport system permease protein
MKKQKSLLARNPRLLISGGILLIVVVIALLAPFIAPYDPVEINSQEILKPSSSSYFLGTDQFGRDIFSRLLYGAQPSLETALGSTLIALVLGTILGMIAGHFRGIIEQLIMRVIDVVLTFPPILLAMMVVGFIGGGVRNLIIIIGIVYIPTFARLAYASTIQVSEMEYFTAAHCIGVKDLRLISHYILPNILSPIIVQASLTFAASILLESGLSFLGLGVTPPTPSWGLMIGDARGYLFKSPMYVVWPSLVIATTILSVNIFGDALRDILDPRLRNL